MQNEYIGFTGVNHSGGSETRVEDCNFSNYINIELQPVAWYTASGEHLPPRKNVFANTHFSSPSFGAPLATYDVVMDTFMQVNANILVKDEVFFEDFNGTPDLDFQVYYLGQAAGAILPQSQAQAGYFMLGAPVPGLTNQQAWNTYEWRYNPSLGRADFQATPLPGTPGWNRMAFAGAVAPATAIQSNPKILGLVQY